MRKNEPTAAKRVACEIEFLDLDGQLLKNQTFLTASGEVFVYKSDTDTFVAAANDATEMGGANTTGLYKYQFTQAEVNKDTIVGVKLVKAGYADQFWFERIDNTADVNILTDSLGLATAAALAALASSQAAQALEVDDAYALLLANLSAPAATATGLATAQSAITDIQTDVDELQATAAGLATSADLATAQAAITDVQTDVDEIQVALAAAAAEIDETLTEVAAILTATNGARATAIDIPQLPLIAVQYGIVGNGYTLTYENDGSGAGNLVDGTAAVFHYEPGVTSVTDLFTALASGGFITWNGAIPASSEGGGPWVSTYVINGQVDHLSGGVDPTLATEATLLDVQTDVDAVQSAVTELLGLHHKNAIVDKYVYNSRKFATSCRLRVFADEVAWAAATIDADDDADGEIARYMITGTDSSVKPLISFSMGKVL